MPIARYPGMPTDSMGAAAAALVLGAAGSLHCFVMCGPLACAAQLDRDRRRAASLAFAYHGARVAAYTGLGALLGAVGERVQLPFAGALPWIMAGLLVLAALDVRAWKRLPPLAGITQILRWTARLRAKASPPLQAALMGAVTPLLPCGLVYGIAATAVAAGSAAAGAGVMGGFALGAVPALVTAQVSAQALARLPRGAALVVQRGLPLVAALVLVYRATLAVGHHACH